MTIILGSLTVNSYETVLMLSQRVEAIHACFSRYTTLYIGKDLRTRCSFGRFSSRIYKSGFHKDDNPSVRGRVTF